MQGDKLVCLGLSCVARSIGMLCGFEVARYSDVTLYRSFTISCILLGDTREFSQMLSFLRAVGATSCYIQEQANDIYPHFLPNPWTLLR